MFLLNGKQLPLDVAFEHDGIRYPANWLRLATVEEKNAIGITEVVEQPRPDDRYYWVTDNGDGTYTANPKDLNVLKSVAVNEIKSIAASMLSVTDWKIIRASETSNPVDAETLAFRSEIRQASNENEALVLQCNTVAQLEGLRFSWPSTATANTN